MRINPLQEILDDAMKQEEPLMDTEWPAADSELLDNALVSQNLGSQRPNTQPNVRPAVALRR